MSTTIEPSKIEAVNLIDDIQVGAVNIMDEIQILMTQLASTSYLLKNGTQD